MIYIHGAGAQDSRDVLHARLDRILFGSRSSTSQLAYYADILHGPSSPSVLGRLRAAATHRDEPDAANAAEHPSLSLEVARPGAEVPVLGVQIPSPGAGALVGLDIRGEGPTAPEPGEHASSPIHALRRRLARHHEATADARPGWLEREALRVIVGSLIPDIKAYFFGGRAAEMCEPLRATLRQSDGHVVLVSHSLGTVIAYHVLHEPEFAGLDVRSWLTVGCPLGVDEIRWLATNGGLQPAAVPPSVRRWTNAADPFDPVALEFDRSR